jgi:Cu2+-containing amine oxidase
MPFLLLPNSRFFSAHPVPIIVIVNIRSGAVIDIMNLPIQTNSFDVDDRTGEEIPLTEYQFEPELRKEGELRTPVARMDVHQPDGVNYATRGSYVAWQNWDFRVG